MKHFNVGSATLADWLRGIEPPEWTRRPNAKDDLRAEAIELRKQGWSVNDLAVRDRLEARVRAEAAAELGPIDDRDRLLGGALIYICEGAKSKPGRRLDRLTFINSDPRRHRGGLSRLLDHHGAEVARAPLEGGGCDGRTGCTGIVDLAFGRQALVWRPNHSAVVK